MKKFLLMYYYNDYNRIIEADDMYEALDHNWSDSLVGILYLGERFDDKENLDGE